MQACGARGVTRLRARHAQPWHRRARSMGAVTARAPASAAHGPAVAGFASLSAVGVAAVAGYAARSAGMVTDEEVRALVLSTFAGLSTTIGAVGAVIRKPDDSTLAFLLGLALGVMATLSIVELWIKNSLDNGVVPITAATLLGALLYYVIQPLVPEFEMPSPSQPGPDQSARKKTDPPDAAALQSAAASAAPVGSSSDALPRASIPASELFRLGILMAITMTLHNMPEGLAVAFSSYTDLGPIMAIAIALHNIPEGVIVAAPIYAATGSRTRALTIATLSGLSEPLGALLALIFVRPFLTPLRLHCLLAFTGGIMLAVCAIELYPEARKCKRDLRAYQGIALGAILMGATLSADV